MTGGKIDLFSEFLDLSRFPEREHLQRVARYLSAKYADRQPDVVIALGEESARFIVRNRGGLADHARIIFGGFSRATANDLKLPSDVIGAVSEFDILKTAELARRLQPRARHLYILGGSADFDRAWLATAQSRPRGFLERL